MWSLLTHIRTLLLSVVFITTIVKFKNDPQKLQRTFLMHNDSIVNFTFNYINADEYMQTVESSHKRKKYRNFILDDNREPGNDTNIYILGLFELSTKFGVRNDGFLEVHAAQRAVNDVNERNVLSSNKLHLLINDTQCDPGAGIDRFFHALYSKKTITMLLGTGCSNVTESLANIVPYWNILQMSFGSTSPSLSDRNKFPLFFRTATPDSSHNTAKAAFIRYFEWDTIATFSQRENTYLLPLNKLVAQLELANVSCTAAVTFSSDNIKEQLAYLKGLDIRIIIASFSTLLAPKIFCEIYNLKMYGADYVWILQYQDVQWWKDSQHCKESHLARATESLIFLAHFNAIPDKEVAVSGLSNEHFRTSTQINSKYGKQTYDAVWAMALALQNIQNDYGLNLSQFYYDNDEFVNKFVDSTQKLKFMGVSGPVSFQGADRVANTIFSQIQEGKLRTISIFYPEGNKLSFNCKNCTRIQWQGKNIPIAKRILKIKMKTIPAYLVYLVMTISVVGIIICLVCLCFNFYFRRKKVVKLSSPRLNNIAVFGCILVYTAVILLGIDMGTVLNAGYFSQLCTVRVYLLSAGFSLAFGSMFAKTYRVHRIFTYSCTNRVKDKILKDKHLIKLILFLLVIDACIVIFWVYFDPLQRDLHNLTIETSMEDRSVLYQPQVEVCRCINTTGWFIAIYGYKGFLLIMGVYMAWETRHIKVEALNDSQYIGICVYSAVFSSIVVLLSNFLTEYIILAYLARTTSILLSATLTLLLLFVPKLKAVFWASEHDPIMQSMGLKIECNTRRLLADDPRELFYRLEVQNKVYKCEIEALDREIVQLEELLAKRSGQYLAPAHAKGARASWPTDQLYSAQVTRNNFLSESTLNDGNSITIGESLKIFDRLKKFFGRIPSVWLNFSNNAVVGTDEYLQDNRITGLSEANVGKAQSMNVYSSADLDASPFFISVDGGK